MDASMRNLLNACLLTLFFSTPALAADVQARNREAKKACLTGDYRKGMEILADLFIETNEPIHIFNQARCLEQSHQWEGAIDRFREYLRKSPTLDAKYVADTNKHIADCEALLEREKGLAPVASRSQSAATPEPVHPPAANAVETASVVATSEDHPNAGSGLRTAGWILGGTGVAAIATAVVLNIKANAAADALWTQQSQHKESQYDTLRTWSWIAYGAGAVSLATGAALYVWGMKAGEARASSPSVALLPTAAADGATFNLFGGF
jgi:hypothetical protein